LYVEMEEMTEKRVYVACFLLLVTTGFAFLCLHVWCGRAASRLIWRNAAATFVLFFVLQFLNVAGWICRWNLERWQRSGSVSVLCLAYDLTLGPSTWPVWVETVKNLPPGKPREELMVALREVANDENADRVATWREQQFRRDRGARALNYLTAPLGPLSEEEDELEIVRAYHRIRQEMRWTALDD